MQTKTQSMIEACTSVFIGYWIAVISQIILYPYFDIEVTFGDQMYIALWFTVISIIRTYLMRRLFNMINGG